MKVVINSETFDFDGSRKPMSEAMAVEREWGRRYFEWETELAAGSLEAFCVFVWLVWRREGRDVALKDVLDGTADFDYGETLASVIAAGGEAGEASGTEVPTVPAGPLTDPAGTPTTPEDTKAPSPSSSA